MIKIALNFESRGTEKIKLSSQETHNFQRFDYETFIIADYEYAKILRSVVLDIKVWLKMTTFCVSFEPLIE